MHRPETPTQVNAANVWNELCCDVFYRTATPFAFVAPGRAVYLTLNWQQ